MKKTDMDIKIFILAIFSTITSAAVHSPKVHEQSSESKSDGNIRNVRNPEYIDRSLINVFHPPVFNYREAKQQDYLKIKYAEQQRADAIRMARLQKPAPPVHRPVGHLQGSHSEIVEEWRPFHTRISRTVNDTSSKNHITAENMEVLKTYTIKSEAAPTNLKDMIKVSDDLDVANSEIVENKKTIDRQDSGSPGLYGEIIYVHRNLLKNDIDLKNPKSNTQINALNDLIGKNPNIQLEGLQRLLNENHHNRKDRTAVSEHNYDNEEPPIISTITKQSTAVNRDTLEDIQKQLDAANKLQTEEVLARAQKQAEDQVKAQHDAIALAQKAIFDEVQKSLHDNPQALALIQQANVVPEYPAIAAESGTSKSVQSSLPTSLPQQDALLVYSNEYKAQAPSVSSSHLVPAAIKNQETKKYTSFSKHSPSPTPTPTRIQPVTKSTFSSILQQEQHSSKNRNYLSPNNIHQSKAQLQIKKPSAGFPNKANLSSKRIIGKGRIKNLQDTAASSNQKFVLETEQSQDVKKVYTRSDYPDDDLNDIQYASKYAFGYQVKDAKEGVDFGHEERRQGKSAEGSYYVLLPDGRRQKVDYRADATGYHAKVSYDNIVHKK